MDYIFYIIIALFIVFTVSVIFLRRLQNESIRSAILLEIENKVVHFFKDIQVSFGSLNQMHTENKMMQCDIAILKSAIVLLPKPTKGFINFTKSNLRSIIFQIWFKPETIYNAKLRSIVAKNYCQGMEVKGLYDDPLSISFLNNDSENSTVVIEIQSLSFEKKTRFFEHLTSLKGVR